MFAVLGLDRTDGYLRRLVTKSVRGQKLPQRYVSKPVAVPTWREFVRYLLLTDRLTYVNSGSSKILSVQIIREIEHSIYN